MTAHQNFAFQRLLAAWHRREDTRSTESIADLAHARISLDSARSDMRAAIAHPVR